ncbi:MAG: hypothetical protein ACRDOU_07875 [Streptosporangiaceae bacterium]
MSVNDVPGWLVTIPPSAIGVPVAAVPGLVPHDDVSTVGGAVEALGGGAEVLVLLELLELLLLLLHPPAARAAAARTIIVRADGANIPLLISPPQGSDFQVSF